MRTPARIDWLGNITFAVGLILILVGITYGLLPYGGHTMGWTSPMVLAEIFGGVAILVVFGVIETRVAQPMFRLSLFRIRAFTAGNVASFLASLSRGGLMFMLIIWLQGIWLPLHGYSFEQTPLWAGIYMIPLTVGFLVAGPLSRSCWPTATAPAPSPPAGCVLVALTFILLIMLPVNFTYAGFAVLIFFNSVGMGMFIAPNQTGHHEQPPGQPARRGCRHGRDLQLVGPGALHRHLLHPDDPGPGGQPARRPAPRAHRAGRQPGRGDAGLAPPPVGSLFAAFLGYNPMQVLLGPRRAGAPAARHGRVPDQPAVLPAPDRARLLQGPDRGVRLRRRRLPARCGGLPAPRRQVPPRRAGGEAPPPEGAERVPAQEAVAETEPLLVD